jgi:hypothetical protein
MFIYSPITCLKIPLEYKIFNICQREKNRAHNHFNGSNKLLLVYQLHFVSLKICLVNDLNRALKDPHPGPSRSPEKGPNPPLEFMLWKSDKF